MKIGLAGWSLNRRFKAGQLTLLDYPARVREEFGLSVIELNSPFFKSLEDDYLKELAARINRAGCTVANIAVDGQGDLAELDEDKRLQATSNYAAWFKAAVAVGSPCIRAFTGGPHEGECTPEVLNACIKSFKVLAAEGKKYGKKIVIENHGGGIARDPDNLVKIMKSDSTGFLGMCPDFGNFGPEVRYEGLAKVAQWAVVLHAKMMEFAPDATEANVDVGRCIDIFKKSGFNGNVLIEYEGKKIDDHEGVLKAKALLQRYI